MNNKITGAAALFLFILSHVLYAHGPNTDIMDRLVEVRLRPEGIDLRLGMLYGEVPAAAVRKAMDLDRDGQIGESEAAGYAFAQRDCLTAGLRVRLDGREMALSSLEPQVDLYGQYGSAPGHLDQTFDFTAPLGSELEDRRCRLEIANANNWAIPGRTTFVLIAAREVEVFGTSLDSLISPVRASHLSGFRAEFALRDQEALTKAAREDPWRLVLDRWTEDYPPISMSGRVTAAAEEDHHSHGGFSGRVQRYFEEGENNPAGLWLLILAAFAYGCVHALEPGHAKTVTAAYLLGSTHRWPRSVLLALTVTITHTGGVLLLALLTTAAWGDSLSATTQAALTGFSGLIVLLLGIQRLRSGGHDHGHSHEHLHEGGNHAHEHDHPHIHTHAEQESGSRWGVIWLGVAGGLVPCPGALWIYLLALGFGRPALAVVLILALSLGLALVLVSVGLASLYLRNLTLASGGRPPAFVASSRTLSRLWSWGTVAARKLPATAGALLILLGAFMLWKGLVEII